MNIIVLHQQKLKAVYMRKAKSLILNRKNIFLFKAKTNFKSLQAVLAASGETIVKQY